MKTLDRIPMDLQRRLFAEARSLCLPGNVPPWTDTGMRVERGEQVSILASGRIFTSEALGLWASANYHLWARIGERGTIFNGSRDTQTFEAPESGPLFLAIYVGEWKTRTGELATPIEAYEGSGGALDLVVIRWKADPIAGLESLAAELPDEPTIAAELARLRAPVETPPGWNLLWFLGQSEIFSVTNGGIGVHTDGDVGILQKPVAFDLSPETTIAWRWKVSELPAREAEDNALTHDYMSLAVEFENGRDITYYWSAALPPETHFACPLPTWTPRETHLVVRSGPEGIGEWQSEKRAIREDYARAMGEPPSRIVAVWLIAVSFFRHGVGRAEFADIVLADANREARVLGSPA